MKRSWEGRGVRTYLELVLEEVFLGGHLAVHSEKALLVWAQGLGGHGLMVILVR